MSDLPRTARALGAAALVPFAWGIATRFVPAVESLTLHLLGPRFVYPYILLFYGTILLAFSGGIFWGLAARAGAEAAGPGYALAAIPPLWAFLLSGSGPVSTAVYLAAGFLGVLGIDWFLWRNGIAPGWWMALKLPMGVVAVGSLAVIVLGF
ncbi:DUF3429 domain-containing protein [Tropicimonas sp.]|uniref:DUF3429 domain-containing protein n=1 Tax=Tropicimonas sp. TaxID=2067044 RepID=UPI003A8B023D